MRRALPFVVIGLIAALLWFLLRQGWNDSAGAWPALAAREDAGATPAPPSLDAGTTGADPVDREAADEQAQSSEVVPSLPADGPPFRVEGRVVDERGAPIADARVDLTAWPHWRPGPSAPTFERDGSTYGGYTSVSGADGRFVIEGGMPNANGVGLWVRAGPFFGVHDRQFQPMTSGPTGSTALIAGKNDLGDIVLRDAGVVRGHVFDSRGSPVEMAFVAAVSPDRSRFGSSTRSEPSGAFELAGVLPGSYLIEGRSEGFRTATPVAVELASGRLVEGVRIELIRAATIEGLVVDEQGLPAAQVGVQGRAVTQGSGSHARSGEDGHFSMPLRQEVGHKLAVSSQEFELSSAFDAEQVYLPGATGVRVIVRRNPRFEFLVVDAMTSAPIEEYGIATGFSPKSGAWSSADHTPLEVKPHPGGRCELTANPERYEIRCEAPGYAPLGAPIEPDVPGGTLQTLRMLRGGAVLGQVLALANPTLILERQAFQRDRSRPDLAQARARKSGTREYDLTTFLGRPRRAVGDAEGRFEFRDLPEGTYALSVQGPGVAPTRVEHIAVAAGQRVDLGAIAMDGPCAISGQVLVMASRSPAGLRVKLAADLIGQNAKTLAADGRFRLEGLGKGVHELMIEDFPGICIAVPPLVVELASGEEKQVVWDLAPHGPAWLCLSIARGGQPLAATNVTWRSKQSVRDLGQTDERGVVCGSVAANGPIDVTIANGQGLTMAHRRFDGELLPGGETTLEWELDCGRLEATLGPNVPLPQDAQVVFRLGVRISDWMEHASFGESRGGYQTDGPLPASREFDLGWTIPGDVELEMSVVRLAEDDRMEPVFSAKQNVTIPGGWKRVRVHFESP